MTKTKTILLQTLIALVPVMYLLSIWNTLPESVPIHYNSKGEANDFGSRAGLLGILFFMCAVAIGTSLMILNLGKLDPKKSYVGRSSLITKISWVLVLFITAISCFVVYETASYTQNSGSAFSVKFTIALVALLFVVLGNYMNTVKPNYFIGFRTPWTLEDEENWRKTHHLGSKIWFFGGLVMLMLVFLLPEQYVSLIVIVSVVPMAGIPFIYSYRLFRRKQKKV